MIIDPAMVEAQAKAAYSAIDQLGEPVVLHKRGPAGFTDYGPVPAFVGGYRAADLIPGGPIEQGDLRAIFNFASWPAGLGRLGRADRVTWRGDLYAVINQDDATRSAAGVQFGVDLQLRGGAG